MSDISPLRSDPGFASNLEHIEADSWLDLAGASGESTRRLDCELIDEALVIVDRAHDTPMSRVLLLGIDRPARPATIARILEVYTSAGISTFSVHLSPIARPTSLPRLLETNGLKRANREAIVARRTSGVEPPDPYFRIRNAGVEDATAVTDLMLRSNDMAFDWASLVTQRLSSDDWRYYIAYDGATPYSLGGAYLKGEVCWMAPVWTLPAYRNRGTQSAMIAYTLRDAEACGCKWVTTYYPVMPNARMRNYQRHGFELVYLRNRYVWEAGKA